MYARSLIDLYRAYWNDIDRRQPKCLQNNLSQHYFLHHLRSHTDWHGI